MGVQDDVDRSSVSRVRHVLDRKNLRDNTLVAVATGELVAFADLASLSNINTDKLVDAWRQLVAVFTVEHADVDDLAGFTVRNLQRGVANFTGLLTEDGTEQTLFWRQFRFTLRRDLADQDIAGANFGTDAD